MASWHTSLISIFPTSFNEVNMRKPAPKKRAPRVAVTPEQRYHMINDAAYFRAIKHQLESGQAEDPAEFWCEVEAEIDTVFKHRNAA
jgi:hypothetical protein